MKNMEGWLKHMSLNQEDESIIYVGSFMSIKELKECPPKKSLQVSMFVHIYSKVALLKRPTKN